MRSSRKRPLYRRKRSSKYLTKQRGGDRPARRLIVRMVAGEGLGNQLFILGIGIRAHKLTKLPLYIILNYSEYHSKNSYKTLYDCPERNIFVLEADNANTIIEHAKPILPKKPDSLLRESANITIKVEDYHFIWNPNDSGDLKVPEDLYQNYANVKSEIPDVKSLLLRNEFENEKNKSIYEPLRNETDSAHSAFMHIRLGDYIKSGFSQNIDFYMNALKELEKSPLVKVIYVICTDEKYYRENESKMKEATSKELRLYNNPNELAALYKMMLCTAGAILSSSTFSAWGAMMGADMNDKSTIVYPKQWIKKMNWGDNPLMFPKRWVPVESSNMKGEDGYDWKKSAGLIAGGGRRRNLFKYTRRRKGGSANKNRLSKSLISHGGMMKTFHFYNRFHYGDNILNLKFFYVNAKLLKEKGIQIHYYYDNIYIKDVKELERYVDPAVVHLHPLSEKPESAIELWMGTPINDISHNDFDKYFHEFYKQILKHLELADLPVDTSLYQKEEYLLHIYEKLDPKFKDAHILLLNSIPNSGQFKFNQEKMNNLADRLSKRYKVVVTSPVGNIPCTLTDGLKLQDIGAISTHVKYIIGMNSGPLIPCLNSHTKASVKKWILFDSANTRLSEVESIILPNTNNVNSANKYVE